MLNDIRERKKIQNEVDGINRQNELILNTAGDGILSLSSNGHISFVKDAVLHLLGYERGELIDQPN